MVPGWPAGVSALLPGLSSLFGLAPGPGVVIALPRSHCASTPPFDTRSARSCVLCCAHPDRTRLSGRWLAMDYSRAVLAGESDFFLTGSTYPRRRLWKPASPDDGQREGCLSSRKMTGFVAAHDPATSACCLPPRQSGTLDKKLAHSGMTLTPGNLSVVAQTCGASNCHTDQAQRVHASLNEHNERRRGVDKFAFGESNDLNAHYDVADLSIPRGHASAEPLCVLSSRPGEDPAGPSMRRTAEGLLGLSSPLRSAAADDCGTPASAAPCVIRIFLSMFRRACFGCHSRSGVCDQLRGWHETLMDEKTAQASPGWPAQFAGSPTANL